MAEEDVEGTVVGAQDMTAFTAQIFQAAGMPESAAWLQAENLVWANLRGHDSHGVLRIPWYIERIDTGDMTPDAEPEVISERAGTALIDCKGAPGPVGTLAGLEKAVEKARVAGIGWAVMRNHTHNGALGYYTGKIAAEDMIGMTTVCSPANMAPYGAKAAGLHNSPISIAIPAGRHAPIVLDMATSVAAGGKIYFAADKGLPIPEGWALDSDGNSTTDPNAAKIWLPFQGPKGSGLAMMFECWSSLLAGNPLCVPRMKGINKPGEKERQNSMIAAIDVSAFLTPAEYKDLVDDLIDNLKALPLAPGTEEILVPGDMENAALKVREREGFFLPRGTMDRIASVADRFDLACFWAAGA